MKRYVSKVTAELSKTSNLSSVEIRNQKNALTDCSNTISDLCPSVMKEQKNRNLTESDNDRICKAVISANNDINCMEKLNTEVRDKRKGKSFQTDPVISKQNHIIGLKLNGNTSGTLDLSINSTSTTIETDLESQNEKSQRNCACTKRSRRSLIPRAESRRSLSPRAGLKIVGKDDLSHLNINGQISRYIYTSEKVTNPPGESGETGKGEKLNICDNPKNLYKAPSMIEHDISEKHSDVDIQTVGGRKQAIVSNLDIINVTQSKTKGNLSCKIQADAHCISRPITLRTEEKTRVRGPGEEPSKVRLSKPSLLPLIRTKQPLNKFIIEKTSVQNKQKNNCQRSKELKNVKSDSVARISPGISHGCVNTTNKRNYFNNLNNVGDVCKQTKVIKFTSSRSLPSQPVLNTEDKIDRNIGQKSVKSGNECKHNTQEIWCSVIKSQVRLPVQSIKAYDPKNTETDWKDIDKSVIQGELRPFDTRTVRKTHAVDINSKTKAKSGLIIRRNAHASGYNSDDKSLNRCGIKNDDFDNLDVHSLRLCHKTNGKLSACGAFSKGFISTDDKELITKVRCDCQNCAVVKQASDVLDNAVCRIPRETKHSNKSSCKYQRTGRLNDLRFNTGCFNSDYLSTHQNKDLTDTSNLFVSTQCTEDLIYGPQRECYLNIFTDKEFNNLHASHCNQVENVHLKDGNHNTANVECLNDKKGCSTLNSTTKRFGNNTCVHGSSEIVNGISKIYKEAETELNIRYSKLNLKDSYTENSNETIYTMHKRAPQSREVNATRNVNIGRGLSRKSTVSSLNNTKVVKPSRNDKDTSYHVDKTVKVNSKHVSSAKSVDSKKDGKLDITTRSVKQNYLQHSCNVTDKTTNAQRCKTAACRNKKTNLDAACNIRQQVRPETIERVISKKVNGTVSDINTSNHETTEVRSRYNYTGALLQLSNDVKSRCNDNSNVSKSTKVVTGENNTVKHQLTDIGHNTAIGEEKNNCEIAKVISSAYLENKSNVPVTFAEEFESGNVGLDQCEVQRSETSLPGSVLSTEENESVKVTNRNNFDSCCFTTKDGALLTDNDLCKEVASKLTAGEFNADASCKENAVGPFKVSCLSICDTNSKNPINNTSEISCLSLPSGESDQSFQNGCENPMSRSSLDNFTNVRKPFFYKENENSSEQQNCNKSLENISIQDVSNYDVFINDSNACNEAVITSDKEDNWRKAMDLQLSSAASDEYCDFNTREQIENENIEQIRTKIISVENSQSGIGENAIQIVSTTESYPTSPSNNSSGSNYDNCLLPKPALGSSDNVIRSELDVKGDQTTIFIQEAALRGSENEDVGVVLEQDVTTKTNISESKPGEINILSTAYTDKAIHRKVLQRNKSGNTSVDNRLKSNISLSKSCVNKKVSKSVGTDNYNNCKSGSTGRSSVSRSRSVTPVCKKSSLSTDSIIASSCDKYSCVVPCNEKDYVNSNNVNNIKQTTIKSTKTLTSKNAMMPGSAKRTPQSDTLKSKIPSASKVGETKTRRKVGEQQQLKNGNDKALDRNVSQNSSSEVNKKAETRIKVACSSVPCLPSSNRQSSRPFSKETSPTSVSSDYNKTSKGRPTRISGDKNNRSEDDIHKLKRTTGKSPSSIVRVRETTPSRDENTISANKSRSILHPGTISKKKSKESSTPNSGVKNDETSKTRDLQSKDNKTIRNKEKLLQGESKNQTEIREQGPGPSKTQQDGNEINKNSEKSHANQSGKERIQNSDLVKSTTGKTSSKSAIPTPKITSLKVKNSATKDGKSNTRVTTPALEHESNGHGGNKILSLTRQNIQRLGQVNKNIGNFSDRDDIRMKSNRSSPAMSRKSSSTIPGDGNGSKVTAKRASISSRSSVNITSKEGSPALSRSSRSTTPGGGNGGISNKGKSYSKTFTKIKSNESSPAVSRKSTKVSSVGALSTTNVSKPSHHRKARSTTSGETTGIKQTDAKISANVNNAGSNKGETTANKQQTKVVNTKTSTSINNGKTSNKLSRQLATSNINSVNRLVTPKTDHVIDSKSVHKRESLQKQTINKISLPRTSTPAVSKFKSAASDNLPILTSKQSKMTETISPENEAVQVSENPDTSQIQSSMISEINKIDELNNAGNNFKILPEERLPSIMQISRCEMSDTVSNSNENMKSSASDKIDGIALFETGDKEELEETDILTDDYDKNKHFNEQLVDIEDNKSTKIKDVGVSEDGDAEDVNLSSGRDSVSDLEEYWSLSDDDNDTTITETTMNYEIYENKLDKKDNCFDLQNNSNYPLSDVFNTSNSVESISEDVHNRLENMKIESRHVQQLHSGESGKYLVQVADDVKTICEIEEIEDDICIPAQMEDFIPQNAYLNQQIDKNKYTFDLQENDITHIPTFDLQSEGLLINCSEQCKNCEVDKKQYGVEYYEEKLPLNTSLDECRDEISDKVKTQISVDWKGVSKSKHTKDLCDEQADECLEKNLDRMSHLSFSNIIPHQNSPDYVSPESEITLETQVSSGLLTVKSGSATREEKTWDENSDINACFTADNEQSDKQNTWDIPGDSVLYSGENIAENLDLCSDFNFLKENVAFQSVSARRLSDVDIKCINDSQTDAKEIQNLDDTENIKCLKINGDISDIIPEDRYNKDLHYETEAAFTDQNRTSESSKTLHGVTDLNISNSKSEIGKLHDGDKQLCNIKYDTGSDLSFDLERVDYSDSDEVYEEICDNSDQSDLEMEPDKDVSDDKVVGYAVKADIQTDSSGRKFIRKRRTVKYETIVKTTSLDGKHKQLSFCGNLDLNTLEKLDLEENKQGTGPSANVKIHSDECVSGITAVNNDRINSKCMEHTVGQTDTIDGLYTETNEEKSSTELLTLQQVSDNEDNGYGTVHNELSIDNHRNDNVNPKHVGTLPFCNEKKLSETGLSPQPSQGHSTNTSINRIPVITTDSQSDKPINIEVRVNKVIQTQSEIQGFEPGLGNFEDDNCDINTGITNISPHITSQQIIESENSHNKWTSTNTKDDQQVAGLSISGNILKNQSLEVTSDITHENRDNQTTNNYNDWNSKISNHVDIPSFSYKSDYNDVLQTTLSDSESTFVNSELCLNSAQVTSVAILRTRPSEDSDNEQTDDNRINYTSVHDLCVTFDAVLSNNENTDSLNEKNSEKEDETLAENKGKLITNQTPMQDQRQLSNVKYCEVSEVISLIKDDDNETPQSEASGLHNENIQTDLITCKNDVLDSNNRATSTKSISKPIHNSESCETFKSDKPDTDLGNQSDSRLNLNNENKHEDDLSTDAKNFDQGEVETITSCCAISSPISTDDAYTGDKNDKINSIDRQVNTDAEVIVSEPDKRSPKTDKQQSNTAEPSQIDENKVSKTKALHRRDTGRNSFRRHTTNVCMTDASCSENTIAVPEKPRARSKSPIGRIGKKGTDVKRPPPSCGPGRVSEICKAFIKKASKACAVKSPERPLSPEPQTTSPSKKLKWIKDCGAWKRVPVDEFEDTDRKSSALESYPSSTVVREDVLESETKINVRDIANKWQMYKRSATEKEQTHEASSINIDIEKDKYRLNRPGDDTTISPSSDLTKDKETTKKPAPRVPPKTLPKPVISKSAKQNTDKIDSQESVKLIPQVPTVTAVDEGEVISDKSKQTMCVFQDESIVKKNASFEETEKEAERKIDVGKSEDQQNSTFKISDYLDDRKRCIEVVDESKTEEVEWESWTSDDISVSTLDTGDLSVSTQDTDTDTSLNIDQQLDKNDIIMDERMGCSLKNSVNSREVFQTTSGTKEMRQDTINDNFETQEPKKTSNITSPEHFTCYLFTSDESDSKSEKGDKSKIHISDEKETFIDKTFDKSLAISMEREESSSGRDIISNTLSAEKEENLSARGAIIGKGIDVEISSLGDEIEKEEDVSVIGTSVNVSANLGFAFEHKTQDKTSDTEITAVQCNKFVKSDKFGLTKSLMAATPYVQTKMHVPKYDVPVVDSGLSQGETVYDSKGDTSTTKGSQKLKAIRIKQEVFPKEDGGHVTTDNLKPFSDKDKLRIEKESVQQWISPIKQALYQLKKQESAEKTKSESDVHFYISNDDLPTGYHGRSSSTAYSGQGSGRSVPHINSGQVSTVNNKSYGEYQFPKQCINSGKYVYSGALGSSDGEKPMLANVDYDNDAGEAMYYPRSPGTIQKKLLSEILELEENIHEEHSNSYEQQNVEGEENEPCVTPKLTKSFTDDVKTNRCREYGRSNSLPSGSLLQHDHPKLYYEDGHFVIDSDYERYDKISEQKNSQNEENDLKEKFIFDFDEKIESPKHYGKDHAKDYGNKYCEFEDEADVFADNDGNVTVIDTDESITSPQVENMVHKRTPKSESETLIPRPLSVDENQLESFMSNSSEKIEILRNKKPSGMKNRRSASFKDISERRPKIKVKRNSSFKEALERGSLRDYNHDDEMTPEVFSKEELRPKSPGFLQRLWSKRKSVSEKSSNVKHTETSKDSNTRKVSLRNLFMGKKGKGNSASTPTFSSEPGTPGTPPIAAFQNDMDIHIIESAPNSPYAQFRRRHTSADIYGQNSQGMYKSAMDISSYRTQQIKSDDQISVQSLVINSSMEQPLRPKSPKPTGVTITRRNSNLSLHTSPHKDVSFEIGGKSDGDSISICSVTSCNIDNVTSVAFDHPSAKKMSKNQPMSQHDKGFNDLVQSEMTYSNSNDSGIQHDVSAHSSNESLKTSQESTSSVIRRRKSPSPRPERPKSEISVRWADLVETTEITPVKRREENQSLKNKPRPISDLGGSSLCSDMKSSFGSQISLQPYSSLQNLEKLKRQDSLNSKPCKRRMSTPHPIKCRQKQATPKQKKQHWSPLVRSHSMPESLEKLHKKKKYITLGSSNLHGDGLLQNGDDDSSSDDGSDISLDRMSLYEKSLSARSSNIQLATLDEISEVENLIFAEALWDHITMDPEELAFRAGDVIEVMDNTNKDWWWGAVDDKDGEREGWFPATFVRLRVNQDQIEEELVTQLQEVTTEHKSPKLRRISMINQDQARENVVSEIIHAEREYVKHLKDVVEGYVRHARKRTDMFSEERISVMFGNIEEIYDFSNRFLESLESAYIEDHPHLSELGQCFLEHSKEFEIYSDYCNNHPSASEELKDSYRKQKYRHFFEACRLLQEMIEIPLEGFLLTPVQKICKYPLQLAELLKFTSTNHPDYCNVRAALESMKKSAALINERKRKMESIEKLANWQQTVEDWQGSDLLERSSELIMSAEANKINSAGWSQERFFFLFDHQLIYCKKDLLKKNGFSYKGRIDMDQCEVFPLEDGKDLQYNVTVKNAWKIHETVRDKWYLLFTKTPAEKQRWLKAYKTERQRVREDQENNFVPVYWKRNILNKLKAGKAKHSTRNTVAVEYQREFIRGMPSHATLPRSFSKKHQEKKKSWFIFGKQKSK